MKTVSLKFPDGRTEKMFMHSIKQTDDVVKAVRARGSLHIDNCQLYVEDYFNEGWLMLGDVITGEHIVSVFW